MIYDDFDFGLESIDAEIEAMKEDLKDVNAQDDDDATEEALAAAYLMDLASGADIQDIAESSEQMQDISDMMGIAMERTIVRLDRKARYNHLTKQAELSLAKQHNDPLYRKLVKLWMMERALEKKIAIRYASKARSVANRKIRQYAANGRRIAKPNPTTVSFKDKVSSSIAKKAVRNSKKMFSNTQKKSSLSGSK